MKKLLESEFIQTLFAIIIVNYLKFCYKTTKWQTVGKDLMEPIWAAKGPVVAMFWHGRLHLGHASWPMDRAQPVCVLASLSKSGDVSVKINTRFGYHSVRGSSAKKSNPDKDKGGAQAFRGLIRFMRSGGCVAMTPDGPRGPMRVMTEGSLKLSQVGNAPMVVLGQSTRNFIQLNTWDKMRLPLPFTRGAIVWDVLPPVPTDCDEATLEDLRIDAEKTLTRVTDQADTMLGLEPRP